MVSSTKTKNLIGVAIFTSIVILILIGIPQLLLVGKGGIVFEETQKLFFSYSIWGIGFLIGILALFFVEQSIIKGDNRLGSGLGFFSIGDIPAIKARFLKNRTNIILLSIILFSTLGLIAFVTNQSFTGIGGLPEQQFTELDNSIFRWTIIPLAENLGAAFFLAFTIFLIRSLARRFKWSKQSFMLLSILFGTLVVMGYGLVNHLSRYSGQETALINVGIFWAIGGLITVLTGGFSSFWIQHISNNMFFDFSKLFSSDSVVLGTIGFILIISFIYGIRLFRGRKKS